ncbi:MAG TPA: prepilin-type N-terminal cleavage/methylation domain-containing protein [Candidatus Paceibacterota bacterium]|nr:prepilin-type N-terminal cleavage/methylation domain-containing protein [Verrucomicrobiota bacterium]HRZ46879.1 prepilin-type N-terminal cleavage/methylation domain-containing protein [Candidatus Paceibacterota bacterium]
MKTFEVQKRACRSGPGKVMGGRRAFTLLELLVVLGILGLLAGLALPALKGLGQSNTMAAASRQLLDDLALARLAAISQRTTVYMAFVPPNAGAHLSAGLTEPQRRQLTNLLGGVHTSYALLAKRSVGDQPGRESPRFITEWRRLPEGVFIATNEFVYLATASWNRFVNSTNRPLAYEVLPFPTASSPTMPLPCVVFNSQGQLARGLDEFITLARGSIFYPKDASGAYVPGAPDVREVPPGNSTNLFNRVYVNWLTGRARAIKPEIQ